MMKDALFFDDQVPWSQEKLISFVLNGSSKYQKVDVLADQIAKHFIELDQIVMADIVTLTRICFLPHESKANLSYARVA